jgi:hypothetical protein
MDSELFLLFSYVLGFTMGQFCLIPLYLIGDKSCH